MRVIFMGTPDFAVPSLEALLTKHEVVLVVTQPDKPKGRGKKMVPTPVKACALEHGIPVLQPEKVKEPEFVEQLRSYEPDLIAVTAFGQILSEPILEMPKYGCINVHGSLLPKYRGAAPMQWSIIDGEKVTGITTMYMAKGLDSGTAFEILSIDIADVDIGRNIGAHLQIQQAEADKQIAQAKAEERRATAIAMEQEMKAEVERMKAKVVEAEAQVPMAMADALRSGNLGVMDYYKFQNVQADTKMKTNFADTDLTGVLHKEPPKDQK